jgi:uncharacterized protein YprB with RNaseH-like and TPR domain
VSTLARLREIVRGSAPRAPVARSPVPVRELTYEPVGPDEAPLDGPGRLPPLEGARWLETPHGPIVAIDREYAPGYRHGAAVVRELAGWDLEALAVLDRRLDVANGRRETDVGAGSASPVFLDLETTGLSGGAGTVAFLVGCGRFEGGAFRTRQFFLQGFGAERALLHAVGEFLEGAPLIVTYNGRTFDVPVLETRWLFHRLPPALAALPHLDMLPPARRLWRGAGEGADEGCRLVALEARLWGVRRDGDVPPFEIPRRYFAFVRRGDASGLPAVVEHNRLDLLSLAAIAARGQRLVRDGAAAAADAAECLAAGRLLDERGLSERAEACFRRVAGDRFAPHAVREQALVSLARLLRRQRRFGEAAEAWRTVVRESIGRSAAVREAVEALAVHHEHRDRDLETARALALQALAAERDPRRRDQVAWRLARLDRKLARSAGAGHRRLLDSP